MVIRPEALIGKTVYFNPGWRSHLDAVSVKIRTDTVARIVEELATNVKSAEGKELIKIMDHEVLVKEKIPLRKYLTQIRLYGGQKYRKIEKFVRKNYPRVGIQIINSTAQDIQRGTT